MNNLLIENKEFVRIITINRTDKLNALNLETISELHESIKQASLDKSVRCIIITGAGEKAFVAGADISEFASFSAQEGAEMSRNGHQKLFNFIENLNKPVIAAINGFALGGGFELALSCHIRIASLNAKMGFPELNLGVIPGYGGTQRLAQLVGKGKAIEMILTGDMIDANKAFALNVTSEVCEKENLMEVAIKMAEKIISKSPIAISSAIKTILANYDHSLNGYETEVLEFGKCFGTEDFKEGVQAFLEKRKPVFPGV